MYIVQSLYWCEIVKHFHASRLRVQWYSVRGTQYLHCIFVLSYACIVKLMHLTWLNKRLLTYLLTYLERWEENETDVRCLVDLQNATRCVFISDLIRNKMCVYFRSHQTHYEQWGELHGTMLAEGHPEKILYLRGYRDHSYGMFFCFFL